jgi:hypothetical protein
MARLLDQALISTDLTARSTGSIFGVDDALELAVQEARSSALGLESGREPRLEAGAAQRIDAIGERAESLRNVCGEHLG